MVASTIQLPVNRSAARRYETASAEEQLRVQLLFNMLVQQMDSNPQAMFSLMDEISDNAAARGLTPEILEQLLDE